MTTGEWLLSLSPLPSGSAMDHLASLTEGGGVVTWVPIQSISATLEHTLIEANMDTPNIVANLISNVYTSDIKTKSISGNITQLNVGADYATS